MKNNEGFMRVLVIVDPQNDFIDGGSLPVKGAKDAMDRLCGFVREYYDYYDCVICTYDCHPDDHCSFKENGGMWPVHCVDGTEGGKIYKPLYDMLLKMDLAGRGLLSDRLILAGKGKKADKDEYSAFGESREQPFSMLMSDNVHVDVAGIAGDVCVMNSVKDMIDVFRVNPRNIRLLMDCIASIKKSTLNKFIDESGVRAVDDTNKYVCMYTDWGTDGMKYKPIITSFLDTDLYKLTMLYFVTDRFPRAHVRYKFVDRNNTKYPEGFADALKRQMYFITKLRFTDDDEAFMKSKCYYLPDVFYTFLRGYRFRMDGIDVSQDADGHLSITITGTWWDKIMWEVMLLAVISELYHRMNGDLNKIDFYKYNNITYTHAYRMMTNGCVVSDFGTRRRLCKETQHIAVKAFASADKKTPPEHCRYHEKGVFSGTSNVNFAKMYDVTPIGTMAHEIVSAIAAFAGSPLEANYTAMKEWQKTYGGALGIFLYDTFGWDAFSNNFSEQYARMFAGLRIDSGNNMIQFHQIASKYKDELHINPYTKQVVFSNALDTESVIDLHYKIRECSCGMQDSYGVGTHLTSYLGSEVYKDEYLDEDGKVLPGCEIKPANIVIKLTAAAISEKRPLTETCKLSNDIGKVTGDSLTVEMYKHQLGMPSKLAVDDKL